MFLAMMENSLGSFTCSYINVVNNSMTNNMVINDNNMVILHGYVLTVFLLNHKVS